MNIRLGQEDLKLENRGIPTPQVRFEHLSTVAQAVVRVLGEVVFVRHYGAAAESSKIIRAED